MPYIGNTIRAADDYRLIDDISSSFNGSTTSFALQVAGSAPVPFPKSPQQVLISVNGVIQEPDPTGASGFNLVGTNIVFSSAPTNGHAFFGIIYATADYLNSGGNFPSGSLGAPSITFVGDEDTGIYRKGSGSVAFVADSTEIANTDSNGITISSGNLIIPDKIIHNGDSNTAIRFPANDTVSVETGGSERLRITSAGRLGLGNNSPDARLSVTDTSTFTAYASSVPSVSACMQQLQNSPSSEAINNHSTIQFGVNGGTHNRVNSISAVAESASNRKLAFTFCTDSGSNRSERLRISADGHVLPGADSTYNIGANANRFANGYFDTLYGNGANLTGINTDLVSDTSPQLGGDLDTNSFHITLDQDHYLYFITNGGSSFLGKTSTGLFLQNNCDLFLRGDDVYIRGDDNSNCAIFKEGSSVELYNNNTKRFSTNSSGAQVHGNNGNIFTASCSTNSTANILFSNTEANTSADMRILVKTAANQGSDPYIKFDAGGNDMIVGTLYAGGANNKLVLGHGSSPSGGVIGLHIDGNGNITPDSNNTRNLGSSSLRFADIFTNDLNLSNEGSSNDVDGTWGNYTIQEGAEDLFLINKRNGKKFKFNLTEVA